MRNSHCAACVTAGHTGRAREGERAAAAAQGKQAGKESACGAGEPRHAALTTGAGGGKASRRIAPRGGRDTPTLLSSRLRSAAEA
jgi:hypothetical protein